MTGELHRIESKSIGPLELRIFLKDFGAIWGFDFLPNGDLLFTERSGKLQLFRTKEQKVEEIRGVPTVAAVGQGGLLDVRVHPDFQKNRLIALSSAEAQGPVLSTAVALARLEGVELKDVRRVFLAKEPGGATIHFGSRLEFEDADTLFITVGDRDQRERAQNLQFHNGKVLRVDLRGRAPDGNPFKGRPQALPEIWSYGHLNPQGLFRDPATGDLWLTETGPMGGDELNLIRPGQNYGWPLLTTSREYEGRKVVKGEIKGKMQQPVKSWTPSIFPTGVTVVSGAAFPQWRGDLFIAGRESRQLLRLRVVKGLVQAEEAFLGDQGWRFWQVRTGPEGDLYFSTEEGRLGRLQPLHATQ